MKKKAIMLCLSTLLCVNQFSTAFGVCAAQIDVVPKVTVRNAEEIYPIDPNDKEWAKLETEEEKFDKTQINNTVIDQLTSEVLLEVIIKNPMISVIEEQETRKDGVETFVQNTNIGKKILEREDAIDAVIKEYLSLEILADTLNDYSDMDGLTGKALDDAVTKLLKDKEFSENVDKDLESFHKVHFLEGFLLQDNIYEQLTVANKRELYTKSLELQEQEYESDVFSYTAEKELYRALAQDQDMKPYIMLRSGVDDPHKTEYVYTPKGSKVKVLRYTNNAPNSDATVAAFKKKNPDCTVYARGYTHTNCHAYTWAGKTSVWLKDPAKFLSDGSYRKVGSRIRPTSPYQKIKSAGHSAIFIKYAGERDCIVRTTLMGKPIYETTLSRDFPSDYDVYDRVC